MEVFRDINDPRLVPTGCVATLGNFDAIHIGHQALIQNAVEDARRLSRPSVVLTFEPHPLRVLAPERAPKLILTHDDKMQLLDSLGVDIVVVQHFDAQLAKVKAEEFVRRHLVDRLQMRKIWIGKDLRFGHNRRGAASDLIRWGSQLGFEVAMIEPILDQGVQASSSRVRQLVEEGRVPDAKPILGRYHFISGKVVSSHRRGRKSGLLTVSIFPRTEALPSAGVYFTLFTLGSGQWLSASAVSSNPILAGGSSLVESFIFDFHRELYSAPVKLSFVQRLHEINRSASIKRLVAELQKNVKLDNTILPAVESLAKPLMVEH